jgi:hypothetical protein
MFISYCRGDLDLADQLDVALRLLGFDTSLDRHAISGGEEWRQRLASLTVIAVRDWLPVKPATAQNGTVRVRLTQGERVLPDTAVSRSCASILNNAVAR